MFFTYLWTRSTAVCYCVELCTAMHSCVELYTAIHSCVHLFSCHKINETVMLHILIKYSMLETGFANYWTPMTWFPKFTMPEIWFAKYSFAGDLICKVFNNNRRPDNLVSGSGYFERKSKEICWIKSVTE